MTGVFNLAWLITIFPAVGLILNAFFSRRFKEEVASYIAIAASGLSIFDSLEDRPDLFIETRTLERILKKALRGLNLDYPIRTRSKVLKSWVCEALGYPVPKSFQRTRP